MASQRLFVAIELPEFARQKLLAIQQKLQAATPVRWTKPAQMHLTLQFLGNVAETKIEPLVAALQQAISSHLSFTLTVEGLGVFPTIKRPRVLWVGVGGDTESLQQLHASVVEATQTVGITNESRLYKAHLTLGRVEKRARSRDYRQISQIVSQQQPRVGHLIDLPVSTVCLIRSELKPSGSQYTTMAEMKLSE